MSASLHALPSCPETRVFELRRAARDTGCQFSRVKPKPRTAPAPFDPNDGGRAA